MTNYNISIDFLWTDRSFDSLLKIISLKKFKRFIANIALEAKDKNLNCSIDFVKNLKCPRLVTFDPADTLVHL